MPFKHKINILHSNKLQYYMCIHSMIVFAMIHRSLALIIRSFREINLSEVTRKCTYAPYLTLNFNIITFKKTENTCFNRKNFQFLPLFLVI